MGNCHLPLDRIPSIRWTVVTLIIALLGISTILGCSSSKQNAPKNAKNAAVKVVKKTKDEVVLEYVKPIVWHKDGVDIKITRIARGGEAFVHSDDSDPKEDMRIFAEITLPSESWDLSEPKLSAGSNQAIRIIGWMTENQHAVDRKSVSREYTISIAQIPQATSILSFDGFISHKAPSRVQIYGPYTIAELSKPVVYETGNFALLIADWSIGKDAINTSDKNHVYLRMGVHTANPPFEQQIHGRPIVYGADRKRIDMYSIGSYGLAPSNRTRYFVQPYYGFRLKAYVPSPSKPKHIGQSVEYVDKGGTAEKAGLRVGDAVTGFNGQDPAVLKDLDFIPLQSSDSLLPGKFTVIRGNKTLHLTIDGMPNPLWEPLRIATQNKQGVWFRRHKWMSEKPVTRNFKPAKVAIEVTVEGKVTDKIPFEIKNIPIPAEFWK